jgi:hypothetical protein
MGGDLDGGEVEHQVGDHGTDKPADELGADQHRGGGRRYGTESPLDERDDRVKGGRHGLKGEESGRRVLRR